MTKADVQEAHSTGESVPSRTIAPLSSLLEKHLKTYAMTAAATGVGLLLPALPADAQVVYTTANIKITDGDLFLDFNCGPRVNFWLADRFEGTLYGGAARELALNGGINASVIEDSNGPAALPLGSVVGSSRTFTNAHRNERIMAAAYQFAYSSGVYGNWVNVPQAYLGLRFDIQGQIHYGWAEFRVNASARNLHVDATLRGYAYELTPNQSIKTGQKSGADGNASMPGFPAPQPGTLQALAQGAARQGGCPDYEPHHSGRHKRSKTP